VIRIRLKNIIYTYSKKSKRIKVNYLENMNLIHTPFMLLILMIRIEVDVKVKEPKHLKKKAN